MSCTNQSPTFKKQPRGGSNVQRRASPIVVRQMRSLTKPKGRLYNTKDARRNSELAGRTTNVIAEQRSRFSIMGGASDLILLGNSHNEDFDRADQSTPSAMSKFQLQENKLKQHP